MSVFKGLLRKLFGRKKRVSVEELGIELVQIPPGKFLMGSPKSETGRLSDETQHEVTLSRGFKIGKYPLTQAQWKAVMGDEHPFFAQPDPQVPADSLSQEDCEEFLSELSRITGKTWRLPTEAEWEYACRAGTQTALNSGKDITDEYQCPNVEESAWYGRNSERTPHPVGKKKPNAWGLYDMHGNIYEWCADTYAPYPSSPVTDPINSTESDNTTLVLRGGCWLVSARSCRSANRGYGHPEDRHEMYGMRPVCELD
jgi:formylglycine-generating enzyme required for sulfatase activity